MCNMQPNQELQPCPLCETKDQILHDPYTDGEFDMVECACGLCCSADHWNTLAELRAENERLKQCIKLDVCKLLQDENKTLRTAFKSNEEDNAELLERVEELEAELDEAKSRADMYNLYVSELDKQKPPQYKITTSTGTCSEETDND